MNKALKAALLSGLAFPGAGYFILGRFARGVVAVVLSAGCLVVMIKSAMDQASVVVDKMLSGEVPLDPGSVERLLTTTPAVSDAALLNTAWYLLLACWMISVADGYRIGRIQDRKIASQPGAPIGSARAHRDAIGMMPRDLPAGAGLRAARPDDLPQLLQLYRHLHAVDDALPVTEIVDVAWQKMLAQPGMQVLVAEVSGALVASVTLLLVPNLTRGVRPYALIENVVTDPAWRGRGIATQLLQLAQKSAWDGGCYKVMLMTGRKDDATLRFYRRAGFVDGDKTAFIARRE